MRYAYALTTALLLGGAAATMTLNQPAGAQTAQNAPGVIQAESPRPGAPMSFAEMVARLQPAVVNISTTQRVQVQTNPFAGTPFAEMFSGQGGGRPVTREAESLGSGFVISADGYVVTNNHVVAAGNQGAVVESIKVTLADGREFTARLIGRDAQSDLAVLKIEGTDLPFVQFGNSDAARVGDWVVAIGNPFGLGGSVTAGIISAVHRVTGAGGAYDRFIQTDASINRGNSGGPMFDLNGNVIGINSMIFSPTGGNVGIGFAIPADEARPVIDTLMRGGTIQRGYLGVEMQAMDDDLAESLGVERGRGTLISRVVPGEAAEKAGVRRGDVITKVDGKEVTADQTLSYLVANVPPGTRVPIEVLRDGRTQTLQLTVGTRPSEEELAGFDTEEEAPVQGDDKESTEASLGIAVRQLTPQIARSIGIDTDTQGVVVLGVDPASDAAAKGLRRGDVISSANRQPVTSPEALGTIVAEAKRSGASRVVFYVQRGARGTFVAIDVSGD